MSVPEPREVTRLLAAWRSGDESALEQLMPLVYHELRRRAEQQLRREGEGHTLLVGDRLAEAIDWLLARPARKAYY